LLNQLGKISGSGKISDPRGICVDVHGNILVSDWEANAVRQYSPDGIWMLDVLCEDDGVHNPWGITSSEGRLMLTEQKLGDKPSLKAFASDA
jgi:streptogramin lyase